MNEKNYILKAYMLFPPIILLIIHKPSKNVGVWSDPS